MNLKSLLVGSVVAAFAVVSLSAMAEEKSAACDIGAKKTGIIHELTLTGKLILKEDIKGDIKATDQVKKDEEVVRVKGSETMVFKYLLETADGNIALPEPKAKPGEQAIDMAALIGKNVKVVAKGTEKMVEGKKVIKVKKIVSVTEEAAAGAEAAAAAEKPAEAPAGTPATE